MPKTPKHQHQSKRGRKKTLARVLPFETDWAKRLIRTESGIVRLELVNVMLALRHAPEWTGLLAYNQFSASIECTRQTPWNYSGSWDDLQDTLTAAWMQEHGLHVPRALVREAVPAIASANPIHPLRNYLNSCEEKWDRIPRLATAAETYLHATQQPRPYLAAVFTVFMVSAVARAFEPGCKVDTILVLEGPQGFQKSTALRLLAARDEWFTDSVSPLDSKDSRIELIGKWIFEHSELNHITRANLETLKSFASVQVDRMRLPWNKYATEYPRQCVFTGTTNSREYLRDETGNRRILPIQVTSCIDCECLVSIVPQLWGEATVLYKSGTPYYVPSEKSELLLLIAAEQHKRLEVDIWEEKVLELAEARGADGISIQDILLGGLDGDVGSFKKKLSDVTKIERDRVARILIANGYKCKGKIRPRKYYPASDADETEVPF